MRYTSSPFVITRRPCGCSEANVGSDTTGGTAVGGKVGGVVVVGGNVGGGILAGGMVRGGTGVIVGGGLSPKYNRSTRGRVLRTFTVLPSSITSAFVLPSWPRRLNSWKVMSATDVDSFSTRNVTRAKTISLSTMPPSTLLAPSLTSPASSENVFSPGATSGK